MILTAGHSSIYDNHWPSSWNSKNVSRYLDTVMDIVKPDVISASDIPAAILKSKENSDSKGNNNIIIIIIITIIPVSSSLSLSSLLSSLSSLLS